MPLNSNRTSRGRDADGAGEEDDSGLQVTGTIDIIYSAQTIARISTAFASYTILNWREGEMAE